MRYVKFAAQHTIAALGGTSIFLFLLAIPIVGFVLHSLIDGSAAMEVEFKSWLIYGLAATAISGSALFSFFLLRAPYQIELAAHKETQAELESLRSRLPQSSQGRSLTGEQKSVLADGLRAARVRPMHFNVLFSSFSEECADFAADIGEAIKSAGLECSVHDGALFESDVRDRGLKLIHGRSAVLREYAGVVQEIMKSAGHFVERREIESDSESIFFYVARNPY